MGERDDKTAERIARALGIGPEPDRSRPDDDDDEEVRRIAEELSLLALATPAVAPSPALRDRVLATAASATRFAGFAERVRELVDLPDERVRALLAAAADPSVPPWQDGPAPGIRILRFTAGPGRSQAPGALVHCAPGARFPEHRHLGEERALILDGTVCDSSGAEWDVGDLVSLPRGSCHSFAAPPMRVALSVVIAEQGIELTGASR